jgi:hypothetical protein
MRDEKIDMDMVKREEEEEEDKGAFPFSWDPLPPYPPLFQLRPFLLLYPWQTDTHSKLLRMLVLAAAVLKLM